ncbi:LysR family transcriptional regulator [Arthrobacter sp. 9V]|uniref:LysR family transcriptional regulator n=1 Tax=Arthrobacter sp. 9V TaxID=2653132 RepID=UPI0012EF40A9|nr:LysR family transcriptional regulator [Arthrobacter sp. 9V]VXB52007.1 LysR family transcriptional regulator [Arthrobacter sp. 9V]
MFVIAPISCHDQWMDLQGMRYVVAVAEEANFTRAAAKCFVAQSALSHRIKAMEKELGVALFSRMSRRVELTAAGTAFISAARACLLAAERAVVDAAAAAGHIRGRLRVGVIPTVTAIDIPAALKTFHRAHPQVPIALQMAGSEELEASIIRGDMDIALLGLPENRDPHGVAWRQLGSDRLVAVVSRDHALTHFREITLSDLAQETFADFPAGTPARAESDQAFAAAGIQREVAFESTAIGLTIDLIRQNLAIALLPSKFAPQNSRNSALISLPISDGPSRVEYLTWSNFNPSPASQAFLALVNENVDL